VSEKFSQLKKEHGRVFLFESAEGRVMFVLLEYGDYATYSYLLSVYDNPSMIAKVEDEIWEKCVVEHTLPQGFDNMKAGIVSSVSQAVLFLSCPKDPEGANQDLNFSRNSIQDALQQVIIFVCEAFPSYVPEDLENMPWSKIIKRVAQAEMILKKEFSFHPPNSQNKDDSDKIFNDLEKFGSDNLDKLVKTPVIDFEKENRELLQQDLGDPKGDFNLHSLRQQGS
jgi:hypothetical protein